MFPDVYTTCIEIAADPDVVFGYFTDSSLMQKWMGRRADLDAVPGGRFNVDIYQFNIRGHYVEVDRPHRLVITWGHENSATLPPGASTIEVQFTPSPVGTLVELTHRGLPQSEQANHQKGWQHFFERLAIAGKGGDPGTDPWSRAAL